MCAEDATPAPTGEAPEPDLREEIGPTRTALGTGKEPPGHDEHARPLAGDDGSGKQPVAEAEGGQEHPGALQEVLRAALRCTAPLPLARCPAERTAVHSTSP